VVVCFDVQSADTDGEQRGSDLVRAVLVPVDRREVRQHRQLPP
jgi:hypothetical protein